MNVFVISAAVIAFLSLIFAYTLFSWVRKMDEGTDRMKELSGFLMECAMAFLKREYKVMVFVVLVLFAVLGLSVDWTTAVLYLIGVLFSVLAGLFGLLAAVRGSTRTIQAADSGGITQGLKIAFRSGAVMGLCTSGLGLLGIGGAFVVFGIEASSVIIGFGFGASTAALFGSVSGGIYKKAADTAADLIGKTKAGVTEGDLRNPAVIAADAGEYISNATGMGADLFESYSGSVIAAVAIAAVTKSIHPVIGYPFDLPALEGSVFPLVVYAAGILAALAGIITVRATEKSKPTTAMRAGKYFSNILTAVLSILFSWIFFGNFNCAITIIIGMLIGAVTGKVTITYISGNSRHLKKIAEQTQTGSLMISEFGIGMFSTLWPMLLFAAGVFTANAFAGVYGIALSAVGLLSTAGMITAIDALGPVSGNAHKIAHMARISPEVKATLDELSSAGRTGMAAGKGYAIGAAVMTSLALFVAFTAIVELKAVNLMKPAVIAGLLLGAMLPVLFSAMAMNSSGKTASKLIDEVKRQYQADTGIPEGNSVPEYAKCAAVGSKFAVKGMLAPGLISMVVPLIVGTLLGTEVLAGTLAGIITSGALTSLILNNTGGFRNHPDKDAAADPFKDAAGRSVNIFIKLMVMVSVAFAPLLFSIGGLL